MSQIAEQTTITKQSWTQALNEFIDEYSRSGSRPGDVPQGDYVVVAHTDGGMVAIEVDGPAAGRVAGIDLTYMSEPAWRTYAPTLAAFSRFWVDVAEAGGILLNRPPDRDYGYTYLNRERIADAQVIARRHDVTGLV